MAAASALGVAGGKVRRGFSRDLPLITYSMNAHDFTLFKKGIDLLAKMYFAAGAKEVCIPGLSKMTVLASAGFIAQGISALASGRLSDMLVARGADEDRLRRWIMALAQLLLGISVAGALRCRSRAA